MHAHGAVYAAVKVHPDLGQIRVARMIGASRQDGSSITVA
jgi:xanthine dehydrogenase YagR molybdenum-binding subunit